MPAFGLDVRETRLVSALRPPDMDRKIVLYHFSTFFRISIRTLRRSGPVLEYAAAVTAFIRLPLPFR